MTLLAELMEIMRPSLSRVPLFANELVWIWVSQAKRVFREKNYISAMHIIDVKS